MVYDYSKLKGKITEVCGTNAVFAGEIKRSERTVSLKLNNAIPWTQKEIHMSAIALGIPLSEIQSYFFTLAI